MAKNIKKYVFLVLFIALTLTPFVIVLATANWVAPLRDISVALGFLGMALAGMQTLPVSRMPWVADAFNYDRVYKVHHVVSIASVVLVALHPILLFFYGINYSGWPLIAGILGLAGLLAIAVTSAYRKQIKIGYTAWLLIHDFLTLGILVFGLTHMFKINYYMADQGMKTAWFVLLGIWVVLGLYMRLARPIALSAKPYKVESVVPQPAKTYSLNLLPDGHAGNKFEAGQIAWISTGKSPFVISRNPFSYSGSAEAPDGRVRFSIKEAGDFTETIKNLKPGDRVFVDGPYGAFSTKDEWTKKGLVLIGGGIGVAPIMSIINTLADRGDQRPVYVFYGDLCEDTCLYGEEFAAAQGRMNLHMIQVLEKPNQPCPYKGYITSKLMAEVLPENYKEFVFFVCGPMPMLRAMDKNFAALGIPASQIHVEKYEMA